jgi:hypothetical protein
MGANSDTYVSITVDFRQVNHDALDDWLADHPPEDVEIPENASPQWALALRLGELGEFSHVAEYDHDSEDISVGLENYERMYHSPGTWLLELSKTGLTITEFTWDGQGTGLSRYAAGVETSVYKGVDDVEEMLAAEIG